MNKTEAKIGEIQTYELEGKINMFAISFNSHKRFVANIKENSLITVYGDQKQFKRLMELKEFMIFRKIMLEGLDKEKLEAFKKHLPKFEEEIKTSIEERQNRFEYSLKKRNTVHDDEPMNSALYALFKGLEERKKAKELEKKELEKSI